MKTLLILFLACILISCSQDDDMKSVERFVVSGKITSVTETGLAAVTVTFYSEVYPDSVHTVVTTPDGVFSISLSEGNYRMEIAQDGYNTTEDLVTVSNVLDSLLVTLRGNASVSGQIIDSQTGDGLAGVTVSFSRDGTPELVLLTNDSGRFEINDSPTGTFTVGAHRDEFFTRTVEDVTLNEGPNELPNTIAVSKPGEGELRIVLSWGEYPLDLDSHFTGPVSTAVTVTNRFHVYWDDQDPDEAVSLDVDDVYSYGPETTTVKYLVPSGNYRYYVHNYAPQDLAVSGAEITESPAVVEVYNEKGLISKFFAPPPSDPSLNLWHVFDLNVFDGVTEQGPPLDIWSYSDSILFIEPLRYYYNVPLNEEGNYQYIFRRGKKQAIEIPE